MCTRQDLRREESIQLPVAHVLDVWQVCHSVGRCDDGPIYGLVCLMGPPSASGAAEPVIYTWEFIQPGD